MEKINIKELIGVCFIDLLIIAIFWLVIWPSEEFITFAIGFSIFFFILGIMIYIDNPNEQDWNKRKVF